MILLYKYFKFFFKLSPNYQRIQKKNYFYFPNFVHYIEGVKVEAEKEK